MPLIVGHNDTRGLYPFVACVIMRTDGNDVLPSVLVVAVPRRLEVNREGVAAIRFHGDRATRLDAAVLISHRIGWCQIGFSLFDMVWWICRVWILWRLQPHTIRNPIWH